MTHYLRITELVVYQLLICNREGICNTWCYFDYTYSYKISYWEIENWFHSWIQPRRWSLGMDLPSFWITANLSVDSTLCSYTLTPVFVSFVHRHFSWFPGYTIFDVLRLNTDVIYAPIAYWLEIIKRRLSCWSSEADLCHLARWCRVRPRGTVARTRVYERFK